jgi:outer membrane protein
MKTCKILFSILTALVFVNPLNAQKEWTLQECINYAHENNIQLKRQNLEVETQMIEYKSSRLQVLPDLNAQIEHEVGSGRVLNQDQYEWQNKTLQQGSMGARSSVDLFRGFRNYNEIKRNELYLQASVEKYEEAKNDLALNIATYYLKILFDYELLDIATKQLDVTTEQEKKTQILVDAGNAAQGDLLEIQSQVASEKMQVVEAKNALALDYLELTQLLDLDSVQGFQVVQPEYLSVDSFLINDVREVYNISREVMPQIQGAEMAVKGADYNLKIAKGARYPTLTLNALYYSRYTDDAINPLDTAYLNPFNNVNEPTMDYTYWDQLQDNQYKQASISLNIPIFNKWQIERNVSHKKIAFEDSKLQLEQAKLVLFKEIQQAHVDAVNALEKYRSSLETVKYSRESFNYTEQKFNVGLVNSIDYNIAKKNLAQAQSDLARSKFEYIFSIKVLDFYMGKQIEL